MSINTRGLPTRPYKKKKKISGRDFWLNYTVGVVSSIASLSLYSPPPVKEIVDVQLTKLPTGLVFYLDFKYNK